MRNGLLRNAGHDGPKDITPQFQALIRQSSRSARWKNKKFLILGVFLILAIVLIGILVYFFVLKGILNRTTNNSRKFSSNTTTQLSNIFISTLSPMNIKEKNITKIVKFPASTTHIAPEPTKSDIQCQTISGFKQQNKIVALFGGFDESGSRLNTIELLPKVSCSLLPRFICLKIFTKLVSGIIVTLYF